MSMSKKILLSLFAVCLTLQVDVTAMKRPAQDAQGKLEGQPASKKQKNNDDGLVVGLAAEINGLPSIDDAIDVDGPQSDEGWTLVSLKNDSKTEAPLPRWGHRSIGANGEIIWRAPAKKRKNGKKIPGRPIGTGIGKDSELRKALEAEYLRLHPVEQVDALVDVVMHEFQNDFAQNDIQAPDAVMDFEPSTKEVVSPIKSPSLIDSDQPSKMVTYAPHVLSVAALVIALYCLYHQVSLEQVQHLIALNNAEFRQEVIATVSAKIHELTPEIICQALDVFRKEGLTSTMIQQVTDLINRMLAVPTSLNVQALKWIKSFFV